MNEEVEAIDKESVAEDVNSTIIKTGKPIMIWRLGSEGRGWIPSKKHFQIARDFIKQSRLEERYDVFLYHFGVDVRIVDTRPWYRRILG